jgi:hypothetical protein
MKTTGEVLLAALALAAIYCTVPKSTLQTGAATIRSEQVVLVADGSDPMPLCHKKVCK